MRTARLYSTLLAFAVMAPTPQPTHDPSLRAVVNIPAARLDVWLGGDVIRTYPVAVGARSFPTPRGSFEISEIIWNPWWVPPESNWARKERPMRPGPSNPMGRVKLKFASLYYLHGTPDTSSVGYPRSHGCIRMLNADAVDFARLVQTRDDARLARKIEDILATRVTRSFHLRSPVPLEIVYDRIEATDTMITLHPDPYHMGPPNITNAIAELEQEGNGGVTDTARLRAFLELPPTRRVVVPRSSMVRKAD